MDALTLGLQIGVPAALVLSLLLVLTRDPRGGAMVARLRSRLVMGIPFGTLTAIAIVLFVYLFVQGAWGRLYSPVTIPFTSWSYLYPLGVVTAPFAHQGFGHLVGNLIGFGVFGAIAEYGFGHFPRKRGSHAFGTWRTNPFVRAFLVVPGAVVGVGLLTSLFSWGPIIGFSGVVFAAAGYALVNYPMATVVALVGREFVNTLYNTLNDPIVHASAGPSYGPPWWSGIAIQGHLLGFIAGVALATIVVSSRRDAERPSTFRLWLGTVIAGSSLTLWAVWWFEGASSYVLYRGPGLLLVLALAVLVAMTVSTSDTTLIEGITRRQLGIALLVLPVMTMGFVAVPLNLTTLGDEAAPGDPVSIEGYEISYAEEVPNQRIGAINISFFGQSTAVNGSGVIVVNRDRQVWTESVSKGRLAHSGSASVTVGGIGWRETVSLRRSGWQVSGGGTAYTISLKPPDGEYEPVYASDPVEAAPVIAGRNISLVPDEGTFYINVERARMGSEQPQSPVAAGQMPAENETVEIDGLTFERVETVVYAIHEDTQVPILKKESYN